MFIIMGIYLLTLLFVFLRKKIITFKTCKMQIPLLCIQRCIFSTFSVSLKKLHFQINTWMSHTSYESLPGLTFPLQFQDVSTADEHEWKYLTTPLQVFIPKNEKLSIWTNWKNYNWDSTNDLIINWMSYFVISKEKRNWLSNCFHFLL